MPVNLKMDATTLASVLAATTTNTRITALKAALGTGTQTVSIKDGGAVEKLTGTFSGAVYSDSALNFIPRTTLGSVSGAGGTATTDWTLRITNGSSRWVEAEFGTGQVWAAEKALDAADATYLSLLLGWQPPETGGVEITEGMSRYWMDGALLPSQMSTTKRKTLFNGHLAPNGPKINGVVDLNIPDSGLVDPHDSKTKMIRVANGSSHVWRSKFSKGQPLDYFNTNRMQFSPMPSTYSGQQIPRGEEIWWAWAFKTPAIQSSVVGSIANMSTSFSGESGIYVYYWNSLISWATWYNDTTDDPRPHKNPITGADTTDPLTLHVTQPTTTSTWYAFVARIRSSWDAADNPSMQVWRKVGSGSPVQIIANDYRNMVRRSEGDYVYPKVGMYWFGGGDPWAGAATGTDMDYDYAGTIIVPVANAPGATHADFFSWLSVRTGV